MYNRYQGNSGQVERMPDAPHAEFRPRPSMPPAAKQKPPPGTTGGGLQQLLSASENFCSSCCRSFRLQTSSRRICC